VEVPDLRSGLFNILSLHTGKGQGSTQFISVYPIWTHKSEATLKPWENVTQIGKVPGGYESNVTGP